jgi:hypothetical protein
MIYITARHTDHDKDTMIELSADFTAQLPALLLALAAAGYYSIVVK